jgi:hypothetical protein
MGARFRHISITPSQLVKMKKIFTAVTILVSLAITESCRKQHMGTAIGGDKVIKQTSHTNAIITKP